VIPLVRPDQDKALMSHVGRNRSPGSDLRRQRYQMDTEPAPRSLHSRHRPCGLATSMQPRTGRD